MPNRRQAERQQAAAPNDNPTTGVPPQHTTQANTTSLRSTESTATVLFQHSIQTDALILAQEEEIQKLKAEVTRQKSIVGEQKERIRDQQIQIAQLRDEIATLRYESVLDEHLWEAGITAGSEGNAGGEGNEGSEG